jgi:hypothetical protein
MMVKSGLEFFILRFSEFRELVLPNAKKISPERLNWLGQLAGIYEGAR